ncbi:DUF3267 domain-containing protein [uncultured Rummeliibacillus sp.]|uniref:DUF3267 domain-containing protein n=1 Tax=uncultured Rummeliibacillus sp. TaxID=762292 RepID=UPI00261E73A0|nr:DUF3267 domain-containing protein [uncultured Rummeliibacillus sp.]
MTFMILWFRHLPKISMDLKEWYPFIRNNWFREHYMKFVYVLQIVIVLISNTRFGSLNPLTLILIGIVVFVLYEFLHIIVVYKKGDISLTFRGTFFWLHTDAILSKTRFWIFMSLPLIGLSVVPAVISFFVSGNVQSILLFISWINLLIGSSDMINSFLILIKPKNSIFYRGYYRVWKS